MMGPFCALHLIMDFDVLITERLLQFSVKYVAKLNINTIQS